ncbi:OLC1v1013498C1 [Oldenlandia corymbosa var. corymbosa]|uniref:OLC1v1013498C1 n=1 Tax=Oldenlandia corymbosa var. corymbosa TaxID=529605 RepID=A0AAV1E0I9_OLDCO|nr:OLC1v1013498C1 [Oldenlandia corymbosa var. corymbosa]
MRFVPTICILLLAISVVSGGPNTGITLQQCSPNTYPDGDPYGIAVHQALYYVVKLTPNTSHYFHSDTERSTSGIIAFALGTCVLYLSAFDCGACLEAAAEDCVSQCNGHMFGTINLVDCSIRYAPLVN